METGSCSISDQEQHAVIPLTQWVAAIHSQDDSGWESSPIRYAWSSTRSVLGRSRRL